MTKPSREALIKARRLLFDREDGACNTTSEMECAVARYIDVTEAKLAERERVRQTALNLADDTQSELDDLKRQIADAVEKVRGLRDGPRSVWLDRQHVLSILDELAPKPEPTLEDRLQTIIDRAGELPLAPTAKWFMEKCAKDGIDLVKRKNVK